MLKGRWTASDHSRPGLTLPEDVSFLSVSVPLWFTPLCAFTGGASYDLDAVDG